MKETPPPVGVVAEDAPTRNTDHWFAIFKTFLAAALVAALIRTFLVEPNAIPSPSMLPTLVPGDYVLATKFAYGYSRHSLPFSPGLFTGRVLAQPVKRGDVVVFKLPRDRRSNFIKRVIGLPGDRIQVRSGQVFINDRPVPRRYLGETDLAASLVNGCPDAPEAARCMAQSYQETLPNGRSYMVYELTETGPADNSRVFTVPTGHYFMMGDNRDASQDSRLPQSVGVGYVPAENLVGRADRILLSLDPKQPAWKLWRSLRGDRVLMPVGGKP